MHLRLTRPAALLAAALAGPAIGLAAEETEWVPYFNSRFGTSVEVPANGFAIDPAPANDDGQSWTSDDGLGTIAVSGGHFNQPDGFDAYVAGAFASAEKDGIDITQKWGDKEFWFAYSGTKGDDIVYRKTILAEPCWSSVVNTIRITYPAGQAATYEPIVKHMSETLKTGQADECQ